MKRQPTNKPRKKKLSPDEITNEIESMNHFPKVSTEFRIKSKFKNAKQKELFNKIIDNRIVFVSGSAGTGKTYITLMAALECLKLNAVNQIVITKPIIEASQSIGFLPGDLNEKISVYMHSFYANLNKLIGKEWTTQLKGAEVIKEVPLNYLRGNTFGSYDEAGNAIGTFCILDEAQNCTIKELKLFLSRMGEGSKLIVMGDIDQTDLKLYKEKSGLDDAFDRFQGIRGIDFIEFTDDDIVRDPLLIEIMKRYKVDRPSRVVAKEEPIVESNDITDETSKEDVGKPKKGFWKFK